MKNIHILSTEKPSKLWKTWESKLMLRPTITNTLLNKQHIYITSDEEIKERDYVLYHEDKISQVLGINIDELKIDRGGVWRSSCKKIILTTDKDLIKNGVQAIDDEFLEWFVKNPSCEFIEVKHFGTCCGNQLINQCVNCEKYNPVYKINILKEEPKTMLESLQEYLQNTLKEKVLEDWNEFQHLDEEGITVNEFLKNQKQETLEEAAERFYPPKTTDLICSPKLVRDSFIAGAKWQQKQMYSDEIINILDNIRYWDTCPNDYLLIIEQFLEQLKK